MTAALIWLAAGVVGIAGHPRIQATPITSDDTAMAMCIADVTAAGFDPSTGQNLFTGVKTPGACLSERTAYFTS